MKTALPIWLIAIAVLAGCASGTKYSELKNSMPALKADEGRIYFYRRAVMLGAAVRVDIKLNGQVVGRSLPGGFFYVDRPAGTYEAAMAEGGRRISFLLNKGETKYIRTYPVFGAISLQIMDPWLAEPELADLAYATTE